MSRIKRKVNVCGGDDCVTVDSLIDSGADRTIIKESTAEMIDLKPIGERCTVTQVDGAKITGWVGTGEVSIDKTCCRSPRQKVLVLPDDKLEGDSLIGNDFMESTGMKIDMSEKEDRRVECDCSQQLREMKRTIEKLIGVKNDG